MPDEVTLTIDGQQVTVPKDTLIIEAAKKLGIDIPVFCYHPKLEPVGACRQCLVEIEGSPKPQVSCSMTVAEGMVVRTNTPEIRQMWESVLEFLLINHPLDCPVCDRGGECSLQDNTFRYGPPDSRFEHEKRHFEKPAQLSALITMDRERCIQCFRCVRFQKEIPDHPQIQMFSRGYGDYIDIFPGRPFESNFSGNTIELCPVGALLSTVFRFRGRPWEITPTESICPNCGVGCNIRVDSRDARRVIRYLARENEEVNEVWLCDRGRFDSAFINDPARLVKPLVRRNGELHEATWDEALKMALDGMLAAGTRAAGLGSAGRTNEQNYLFQRFLRLVVGTNNIDYTVERRARGGEDAIASAISSGLFNGSIREIPDSDAILALGSDISQDLPLLDLWVKKAVRQRRSKLVFAYPLRAELAEHASCFLDYSHGHEAEFAGGLADALAGQAPAQAGGIGQDALEAAAKLLAEAGSVSVLVARSMFESAEHGSETPQSIRHIVGILRSRGAKVGVLLLIEGGNGMGAMDVGLLPGHYPGYRKIGRDSQHEMAELWGAAPPSAPGLSGWDIIKAAQEGEIKAMWVMGQDPAADPLLGQEAAQALSRLDTLVVQDHFLTATAEMAQVVLPSSTFAETRGTFTSTERRVQNINPAILRVGDSEPDTDIILKAAFLAGATGFEYGRVETIFDEIARVVPAYQGMTYDLIGTHGRRLETGG